MAARRALRRRRQGEAAALGLAAYLDAQLAHIGRLDPKFALLRGRCASVVQLGRPHGGPPAADPEAAAAAPLFPTVASLEQQAAAKLARLQQLQAATAAAAVRVMGGSVSATLGERTTHLVGLALPALTTPAGEAGAAGDGMEVDAVGCPATPAQVPPEALLQAAGEQLGGAAAVSTLKLGFATGGMHPVTLRQVGVAGPAGSCGCCWCSLQARRTRHPCYSHPCCSWVDRCLEAALQPGTAKPPPEAGGWGLQGALSTGAVLCPCLSLPSLHPFPGRCPCALCASPHRLCTGCCGRAGARQRGAVALGLLRQAHAWQQRAAAAHQLRRHCQRQQRRAGDGGPRPRARRRSYQEGCSKPPGEAGSRRRHHRQARGASDGGQACGAAPTRPPRACHQGGGGRGCGRGGGGGEGGGCGDAAAGACQRGAGACRCTHASPSICPGARRAHSHRQVCRPPHGSLFT